ncbi:MAG TPA: PPOX class F420-dependent oxidoreductase [Solirubrobacteraceae bacterium]|jgi:PPOX class probable F420-dependent enzyme|nr:PPOX class F420-dependent oxidoreductase [Solirubrobacteraceae bacterium]
MTDIHDPEVQRLLDAPNVAVISTRNPDDSILSAVVWQSVENGHMAVNSAKGRQWPANLDRDPHITLVVVDPENPYSYVQVRGRAEGTTDGADEHINELAKKYLGQDEYPFRQPGEERIKFVIQPEKVTFVKQ